MWLAISMATIRAGFQLLLINTVFWICLADQEVIVPQIYPNGFNASLSEDTVEFKCTVPATSGIRSIDWDIDGIPLSTFGKDALMERGIISDRTSMRENNTIFAVIGIQSKTQNDNTTLGCVVLMISSPPVESKKILLKVQGPLAPPTSLETTHFNSTHDLLVWEDPYTLDLTNIDPDITGYTITITMENPPPLHPYNHPLTLEELEDTRTESFTISSSDGPQFPFPRYTFPMWLRVSVENPAGLGEISEDLKHSIEPQSDCMRFSDLPITLSSKNKVVFNDSTPSVEIFLFQIPSQSNGNYCLDTVEVVIDASYEEISPLVLVPTLSGTGISVILESGLEEDTSYTATLFSNSTLITTTNFTTFAVQDISISVVSNELTVQCQFAEGSTHDMCTVILLLNGEKYRMENSTGEITFSDLLNGTYTVLVYDSGPEVTGGSGDLEIPAIETTVTISGGTTSPSPSADLPSATDLSVFPSTTAGPTDEKKETGISDSMTYAISIATGVAVFCVLIVSITTLILIVRKCSTNEEGRGTHKTSNLSAVSSAISQPSTLDAMSSPLSSSKITTQPNSAYAPIVPFQTYSTPAMSTNTNVAYSVLPTTHSNSEYEIVQ